MRLCNTINLLPQGAFSVYTITTKYLQIFYSHIHTGDKKGLYVNLL